MKRLALFLITACLSAGAIAADVIKSDRKEVFGDITVHYNTFNSTFLTPDIADAAGLSRGKTQGVINVSVLKDGKLLQAEVSGTVKDLTSSSVTLNVKEVADPNATYYNAKTPAKQQETRHVELKVKK